MKEEHKLNLAMEDADGEKEQIRIVGKKKNEKDEGCGSYDFGKEWVRMSEYREGGLYF